MRPLGIGKFPSPQVGSEHRKWWGREVGKKCFHPLKSGRNQQTPDTLNCVGQVSIPSSRVGTGANRRHARHCIVFPSPQVGSELHETQHAVPRGEHHVSIPSSRVGTTFSTAGRYFSSNVSIPSSRVGTITPSPTITPPFVFPSPQVGSELKTISLLTPLNPRFHPLKSGRNRTYPRRRRQQLPCFHPLKSGRNRLIDIIAAKIEQSFHPLKSGRNLSFKGDEE